MNSLKKYYCRMIIGFLLGSFVIFVNYAAAQGEAKAETKKLAGTVDAVYDDHLVINDSSILLDGSVLFYKESGGKMSGSEFRVGDQVAIVLTENEALGNLQIVSVTRTKGSSGKDADSSTTSSQQIIRQDADGVWRNY